jgi:hypothetical protein
LAADKKMTKYQGEPRLIESVLKRFKADDFVFVCDMLDLFGEWVLAEDIKVILGRIDGSPAKFLLLTKNPQRYLDLLPNRIPFNCIIGCTIESNRNYLKISGAPAQYNRLYYMAELRRMENKYVYDVHHKQHDLFLSIEPILDFDLKEFSDWIINMLNPWAVAVGYDNYNNHLPEPSLAKTMQLIERLEKVGITVYRKTLRRAWNENAKA